MGRHLRRPLPPGTNNYYLGKRNVRFFVAAAEKGPEDESSSTTTTTTKSDVEWRKQQLDRLERKFSDPLPTPVIDTEDDLQSAWKEMESRVTKRRSLTVEQRGGKTGRTNIRRTEEDVWLEHGLYDDDENKKNNDKEES